MFKIEEYSISSDKNIVDGLTQIYGIGRSNVHYIIGKVGISKNARIKDIEDDKSLSDAITACLLREYTIGKNLKRREQGNIGRLVETVSYRGARHRSSLSVRGQRTHGNCKTQKRLRRFNKEISRQVSKVKKSR